MSPTLNLAIDLIRRPSVTPTDAGCQDVMIGRLEARLRDKPDDGEGWLLLARTQAALEWTSVMKSLRFLIL